ncbi:MAG: glycosyl hydrolase 115 family protein, partial [Clostridia bacterium]|nr:glycosyl hydrolase 115 family protein [Clostridia bacterium]
MSFLLNYNTQIKSDIDTKPVLNAIKMLERDIEKSFNQSNESANAIVLKKAEGMAEESYKITVADEITVTASDNLGFVYGLINISEKYLGIKPFWFWLDQKIEKKDCVTIDECAYESAPMSVRFRGWFFNDEVLMMTWRINGSEDEHWRMAFEALLRCGGNMTIPGTDKNARLNRQLAADMGLWITHHHAEPLGAEMFARAYPGVDANFMERPELFYKLWEDAVTEQKDYNVVWNLCFRGQGDCPFWSSDTTGEFNTPAKRGAHISAMIRKQCDMVRKHVKNPVFCTNLYGEIMELYEEGHIDLDEGVIKVQADNGYAKMVTRRRDNHNPRVSAMPVKDGGCQGIYYHVSFYDLQAANHITMLPNSVNFVNNELNEVLSNDGNDFWVINCSNVKPHAYYLDAVRKKWMGREIDNESHSKEFSADYYGGEADVAKSLAEYANSTIAFGEHDDEHAGEQFYNENVRIIANNIVRCDSNPTDKLNWIVGMDGTIYDQTRKLMAIVEKDIEKINKYYDLC